MCDVSAKRAKTDAAKSEQTKRARFRHLILPAAIGGALHRPTCVIEYSEAVVWRAVHIDTYPAILETTAQVEFKPDKTDSCGQKLVVAVSYTRKAIVAKNNDRRLDESARRYVLSGAQPVHIRKATGPNL